MWVRFKAEHWHRFNRQMSRRYLAGEIRNVPTTVGEGAIAAGRAVKMKRSRRAEAPVEVNDGDEASRR